MKSPSRIAVTGLNSEDGVRIVERLLSRDPAAKIMGLDLSRPLRLAGKIDFHALDLTSPTADVVLAERLAAEGVEVLVHLAFRSSPTPDIEEDHELETIGSLHVMNAVAAAKLPRLVVSSSTMLYGARPDNPNYLSESHALRGHPDAHCVQNRVEVENLLADWSARNAETEVTILRSGWVVGPSRSNYISRFFEAPVIPTVLGFDPLLQLLHEDDLLDVYEESILHSHPGIWNVVGREALPLSTLVALAGKRRLALPSPLLYRATDFPSIEQTGDRPAGFFDYLRYLWVADGERAWAEFGDPVYSTQEAWSSFVSSRRL
ncbi:MAG: NAD-dependent epimerase/dehydratase family protein [Myxococcota bacterium]|nr:NAD-dependent epimerase/dehydratase family protein [Myxococcota bacterium]